MARPRFMGIPPPPHHHSLIFDAPCLHPNQTLLQLRGRAYDQSHLQIKTSCPCPAATQTIPTSHSNLSDRSKMMREGPQSAPRPNATLPFFPARPLKRHVPQVAPHQTKIARPTINGHSIYDEKLKLFALYQAKATAALNDLMPEFRARPPPSVLTEFEDVKREMASREKDLETTISRLTHKNKVFSARCDSNESQLVALEAENMKTIQELMVADNKYSGARAAGYAQGLKEV